MTRIDHLNDLNAPKANSIVPAASAIIENEQGAILLHKRSDSHTWSIPGGAMEIGESINETVIREVQEETGFLVQPEYLIGVYTDPQHIIEYSDGEIRQEFSLCFACKIVGGKLQVSDESTEVAFFNPQEVEKLDIHKSIRQRINHYLQHKTQPVIA